MSAVSFELAAIVASVGFLILYCGVSLHLMARAGREGNHSH